MNTASGRTPDASLLAVVGVLALASFVRTFVVPGDLHPWFNVATVAVVVAIGRLDGLGAADLGLSRSSIGPGLRLGGIVFLVIAAGVTVATLLPSADELFADDRADVSTGEMLRRTLVVIPLGTVLLEELVFRGVLVGLLLRVASRLHTLVVASVVFGLWHVLPAWNAADGGSGLDNPLTIAVVTLIATTLAGAGFTWLRLRSDSLIAPCMAHVATNSVTFAAAWVLVR